MGEDRMRSTATDPMTFRDLEYLQILFEDIKNRQKDRKYYQDVEAFFLVRTQSLIDEIHQLKVDAEHEK